MVERIIAAEYYYSTHTKNENITSLLRTYSSMIHLVPVVLNGPILPGFLCNLATDWDLGAAFAIPSTAMVQGTYTITPC